MVSFYAEHHHHCDCSKQCQKTLDDHCKTVVHRLLHRVDIVGKMAHDLAARVVVKIFQWEFLCVPEQIHADFAHDFLRGVHHQPVIAERCERTAQVHHTHADD